MFRRIGGSKGEGTRDTCLPLRSNFFFIYMQFLGKHDQHNNMLTPSFVVDPPVWEILDPPLRRLITSEFTSFSASVCARNRWLEITPIQIKVHQIFWQHYIKIIFSCKSGVQVQGSKLFCSFYKDWCWNSILKASSIGFRQMQRSKNLKSKMEQIW